MAIRTEPTSSESLKSDAIESKPNIYSSTGLPEKSISTQLGASSSMITQEVDVATTEDTVVKKPIYTTIKVATDAESIKDAIEKAQPFTKLSFGRGFQMDINEKGVKTFQLRYSIGKGSTKSLGRYPDVDFYQAQIKAEILREQVNVAREIKQDKAFKARLTKPKAKKLAWNVSANNFKSEADAAKFISKLFEPDNGIHQEIILAVWLQMLIPSRASELLCAQWSNVDLSSGVWKVKVPAKYRQFNPEFECLSEEATARLRELEQMYELSRFKNGGYLFPSLSNLVTKKAEREKILTDEMQKIWLDYHPDIFINFFITMANKFSYFQPEFIEAMTTHKDNKNKIYNNPDLLNQRKALANWWGAELKRLRDKPQTDKVIF